jgi:ERCC4-type nuclease
MILQLKIDNRERTIIPALETACSAIEGVFLTVENMDLGDAGIYDDNGNELILFERKSLVDLASSIKDGRYSEQSMRLKNQELANHNIIYIIEGSMENYKNNPRMKSIHYKTLMSAMVSLNYFKGFSVVRTLTILETIDLIMSYVAKIFKTKPKHRNGYYSKNNKEINEKTEPLIKLNNDKDIETVENNDVMNYVSVIKRTKKENITVNNILAIMLCQIPGISAISAEAVTLKYPTIEELVNACKEGKTAFDKLRHKNSNRRLSSQCINNIITYILGNKPQKRELSINID